MKIHLVCKRNRFIKENKYNQQSSERGSIRWLAGVVVFFVIAIGAILISNIAKRTNTSDSVNKKPETSRAISTTVDDTVATQNNRINSPVSENTSLDKKLDVTGTWIGKNTRDAAPMTLVIDNQEGNSFRGTLKQKSWFVLITGSIDIDTRQITIRDTRVITQNVKKDGAWSLAEREGTISKNGKQISIKGKDQYGSFSATYVKRKN